MNTNDETNHDNAPAEPSEAGSVQRLALRTTDKSGASPRSLQRLAEWEDWTDAELDALKAGFKTSGCPEVSVYLLTHKDSLRAQCPPCGVWFAVEEIERAKGCPKCGQTKDFEVPDEYAALVGEGEKPCEQSRAGSQSDQALPQGGANDSMSTKTTYPPQSVAAPCSSFRYDSRQTPDGYVCAFCGGRGVRLYREYQTFLDHQKLRCRACACKAQRRQPDGASEHSIGWLVAAVPTEDGSTYWGFTSVPKAGVEWWNALPKQETENSVINEQESDNG